MNRRITRRAEICFLCAASLAATCAWMQREQGRPVGKTDADRSRNDMLLAGYDYSVYPGAITGYNGQDLQRIVFTRYAPAVRTRVGPRGNYKAGFTRLHDGRLLLAVCRAPESPIFIYESTDDGLTWRELAKPDVIGKEASLTTLPDGSILMTAQSAEFSKPLSQRGMICARSEDDGRTWKVSRLPGERYPRNVIVEGDGSLVFLRPAQGPEWKLQLCRSRNGGRTWEFSEATVAILDDNGTPARFSEIAAVRLDDGRLLAAFRTVAPESPVRDAHGFGTTLLAESTDNGRTWSKPWTMSNTAEVHVYLTQLDDGRLLATYSNYHLPFGVYAIVSEDQGKSWDLDHPVQLALSAKNNVGWPVTLQLPDGSLITSYALTAYLNQPPDLYVCEVVRWRLP